jgi:hypothetical protein
MVLFSIWGVALAQEAVRQVGHYNKRLVAFDDARQGLDLGALPQGIKSWSAKACGECHQKEHEEWKQSIHAGSATEPIYRKAFDAEPRNFCRSCHSPLLAQHPKRLKSPAELPTDAPLSEHFAKFEDNPQFDAALMEEGITCVTCHVRDGMILTSNKKEMTTAPHPLAYSAELGTSQFCGSCHEFAVVNSHRRPLETTPKGFKPPVPTSEEKTPRRSTDPEGPISAWGNVPVRFHSTLREWRTGSSARTEQSCQTCHMPTQNGRRSHTFPGGHSFEMLQKAVTLSVRTERQEEKLTAFVTLKSDGVGHSFPSGDPTHQAELRVTLLADGQPTQTQRYEMRLDKSGRSIVGQLVVAGEAMSATERQQFQKMLALREMAAPLMAGEERTLPFTFDVTQHAGRKTELKVTLRYHLLRPDLRGSVLDPGTKDAPTFTLVEKVLPVDPQRVK